MPTPTPNQPVLLIAIEGPDGGGKSAQTALLEEALGATTLHFPVYTTPTGRIIKRILSGHAHMHAPGFGYDAKADAIVLQSLMLTNRYEALNGIKQDLIDGYDVILDRYMASGLAYGEADGLDRDWLHQIHNDLPRPHIQFLIDIPIAESFKRRPERECAYEADRERLERAAQVYRDLWQRNQSRSPLRYVVIDGMQSPTVITNELLRHIAAVRQVETIVTAADKAIADMEVHNNG